MTIPRPCPLCTSSETRLYEEAHGRSYDSCATCGMIFMRRTDRLDPLDEKARYETHENHPEDEGYRAFLSRLADPLLEKLPDGAVGLDYGAGPGPTLSVMLEEHGYEVAIYDPFFAPDPSPLDETYDFVTCTETAEHFFNPHAEFRRMLGLLRPGGWLGVMTQFVSDHEFQTWRYVRDETHVCFYRLRTMHWIADHFGLTIHVPRRNVALFQRAVSA